MRNHPFFLMACLLLGLSCSTGSHGLDPAKYKSLQPVSIHSLTNTELRVLSVRLHLLRVFCTPTNSTQLVDCSEMEKRFENGYRTSVAKIYERLGDHDDPQVRIYEFEEKGSHGESGYLAVKNNRIIKKWVIAEW
jgi:hypothetical protein